MNYKLINIKKSILLMLTIALCILSFPTNVKASTDKNFIDNVVNTKYYQGNEYQELLNHYNTQIIEFSKNIVTNLAIQEDLSNTAQLIQEYKAYIYQLKELSIEELRELNYTDSQIDAIKNYDGSEEMSTRAAATVTGVLTLNHFYYDASSNRTYVSVRFRGWWNGTPMQRGMDETGIAILGSNARFAQNGSSNSITHANGSVVTNTNSKYYSMIGKVYKFGITDGNGQMFQKFDMTYNGVATGEVSIMDYGAAYVHNYQTIAVSSFGLTIGLDSTPSIGISFTVANNYEIMWSAINTRKSYVTP